MILVVMGVAGVGKSSVMAALADRLGWRTLEGDALHPPSNVAKMAAGTPLTDADRWPWLDAIAAWMAARDARGESGIVTCSALRRAYRDRLRAGRDSVRFVHLVAPRAALEERIGRREGHFMPAAMLQSQLDTLEPLEPDEPGWTINALLAPQAIAAEVVSSLG